MKRLALLFFFFLIGYSTYYDLTIGTLPTKATIEETTVAVTDTDPGMKQIEENVAEVLVKPGDTVLSIVEHIHDGPIKASIKQIIYDFETLNPDTKPDDIQIGNVYRFPIYQQ